MLKAKSFVKRTRGGGVVKIVREHYLRDDITCGAAMCASCMQTPVLAPTAQRVAVIDTNIAYHNMDVLAHPAVTDVVVPSTVIEELRSKQPQLASRLRSIVDDKAKRFYVFSNEHHRDTYIEAKDGESPNDRNDRGINIHCLADDAAAIRVTALWYSQHLGGAVPVILISNDAGCRSKAADEGVRAIGTQEWVRQLGVPELLDIAAPADTSNDVQGLEYSDYLSPALIEAGLRDGTLYAGVLHVNGDNLVEASISTDALDRDILISGTLLHFSIHI